ncbi:MAG: hypothetical protein IPJ35_05450 [Elusimicrobia bacterium]|nr:hypothetical protein [Elusimicrobiota bacterium]
MRVFSTTWPTPRVSHRPRCGGISPPSASPAKKRGYSVQDLLANLDVKLGKEKPQNAVVLGVGNIGRALLNYRGFATAGIRIVAGFDSDPENRWESRGPDPAPGEIAGVRRQERHPRGHIGCA